MIMESSADLHDHHHHHQLQELHLLAAPPLPITSSLFSTTSSTDNNCFSINAAAWNLNLTSHHLIGGGGNLNGSSSSDVHFPYGGFHDQWSSTTANAHDNQYSTSHAQEYLPDDFPSTSRSTSTGRSSFVKQEHDDGGGRALVTNNHGDHHLRQQFAAAGVSVVPIRGGNYSQIFPTTNITSTSNNTDPCSSSSMMTYNSSTNSSVLGMNLQALDLWTANQPAADHPHYSMNNLPAAAGFNIIGSTTTLPHYLQQDSIGHHNPASYISSKQMPSSPYFMNNGVVVAVTEFSKRCSSNSPSSSSDHQLPKPSVHDHHRVATKKPRTEPRSSFAPFKVRKEKLGDRIAALQQLVAPFGKTDTASVLMEAIGYIKFLQHQVETLSIPYMKSSRSRAHSSAQIQGVGGNYLQNNEQEEGSQGAAAAKQDLRSRGLCLVPLSCTSYF